MQTNVKSTRLAATGTVRSVRTRIKGVYVMPSATAGSLTLRDGGAGGSVQMVIDTPASATEPLYLRLPGEGVLFETDVHATLSNVTSTTLFFT